MLLLTRDVVVAACCRSAMAAIRISRARGAKPTATKFDLVEWIRGSLWAAGMVDAIRESSVPGGDLDLHAMFPPRL